MMRRSVSLLLTLSLLSSLSITIVHSASFKCSSSTSKCQSLLGYSPINTTQISAIQSLFGVESLSSLLGANSLPPSTSPNRTVQAGSTFRIPIPCNCSNGTGISDGTPFYTVKDGDQGLFNIANSIFSGFVTFQAIAAYNKLPNANEIQVGQRLRIPLPRSCDEVGGRAVVHYGHVVAAGSSVSEIADKFGTTEQVLLALNDLNDPKDLLAGQILDVPLRACSSSISNTSLDSRLLLTSASYALTAHNCVECSCDATDWQLKCKPSQGMNISDWSTCPSMLCEGSSLSIGNTSTPTNCSLTACAYSGYANGKILTNLTTQSTCPNSGAPGGQNPPNSADGSLGLQDLKWMWIFISLNMGLLSFGLLW